MSTLIYNYGCAESGDGFYRCAEHAKPSAAAPETVIEIDERGKVHEPFTEFSCHCRKCHFHATRGYWPDQQPPPLPPLTDEELEDAAPFTVQELAALKWACEQAGFVALSARVAAKLRARKGQA